MENSQADCLLEGSHVDQKWPRHSHSVMLRHWLEFPRKSMALTLNAVLDTKCAVVGSYQLLSLQLESKFYLERRSEQHTSVAATGSNITAFLNRGKLKKEFKLKTCFNSNKSHLYLSITLWFSNHFHIHGSSFIIKLFVAQVFKSKHISLRLLCDCSKFPRREDDNAGRWLYLLIQEYCFAVSLIKLDYPEDSFYMNYIYKQIYAGR